MSLCSVCINEVNTDEVKVCQICGKSSDQDPTTLYYCKECAEKRIICQSCGKKIRIHRIHEE